MSQRERHPWQSYEDDMLRAAVAKEDPSDTPSKWYAIAKHVPNRTNKDCRKRWFAKMASDVTKGGWSFDEDERLLQAIEKYGTRWSMVSSLVQTRNSDQCSKRWCDTLDPSINKASWTPETDELLMRAVHEHGKVWTKIVKSYFPGRTGLAAKNRYNSITRFHSGSSKSSRSSTPVRQQRNSVDRIEDCGRLSGYVTPSPPTQASSMYNFPTAAPSSYPFNELDSYRSTPSAYPAHPIPLNHMVEDQFLSSYDFPQQESIFPYPLPSAPSSDVAYMPGKNVSAPSDATQPALDFYIPRDGYYLNCASGPSYDHPPW